MNNYLAFDIRDVFHPAQIFVGPTRIYGDPAGFGRLASDVLLILTGTAGALSLMFIVIAGIKFVTSGGDPKKLASATSTLTYAIIGIAVTILAFVVLRIVQFFLKSAVPIT